MYIYNAIPTDWGWILCALVLGCYGDPPVVVEATAPGAGRWMGGDTQDVRSSSWEISYSLQVLNVSLLILRGDKKFVSQEGERTLTRFAAW